MTDRIVGIDLGTSNTVVAIVDELDRVKALADADGTTVHPSVVSFHPNGGVVIGLGGKQRKVIDPQHTIYSAKRMIGQPFRSHAVTETSRRVPFVIKEGPNEQAMVVTRAGEFAIPEISAIVLDHVGRIASKAIGTEVTRAVVTVPASFTDVQRAATATAGALAGLTVVRVLNEPTAAALAYGSSKRLNEIIAVYDFGGGTFDITILKLEDQVYTVLGTSGDAFLGGEDIDERIVDRMVQTFLRANRVDLRTDDVAMMRLRAVAEHTKIELSRRTRAVVKIEEIAYGPNGVALDLTIELRREELISAVTDLVERTFVSCKEAMALAGVGPDQIADVVLVGGTTRIPHVRDQVARFFNKAPRFDVNPDDAIATGAALTASSIEQMLARAPARPPAAAALPVVDPLLVEPAEPAPTRTQVAETKRPKNDPVKTAAQAKAFFGDLFGDKAKPELPKIPSVAKPAPITKVPSIPKLAEPARTRRPTKELDWAPPEGSAFSDDADAVDVFAPEPAPPADPRIADLSDQLQPEFLESEEPTDLSHELRPESQSEEPTDLSAELVDVADEAEDIAFDIVPERPPNHIGPWPATASGEISIEVAEPSMPAIRLDELDLVEISPRQPASDEIIVEVSMPAIQLEDLEPPPEPAWATPEGVELSRQIVVPVAEAPIAVDVEDIELAPRSTPPSRRALELALPQSVPTLNAFEDDLLPPIATPRRAVKELDWDPSPFAPPQPVARPAPQPEPPPARRIAAIVDVTPRGLGIATVAGFCEELILRNSQLPATIRKSFVTSRDAQETVRIVICQGESRRLTNNVVIGDLVLPNLPRRARGETRIDVEFELDASGILHVSARDSVTGAEQRAHLDIKGGMAPEDMSAAQQRLRNLARVPPS